jgi:hypothetical protein
MTVRTIGTKRSQASSVISGGIVSYRNPDNTGIIDYGSGYTNNTIVKGISSNAGTVRTTTTPISGPSINSITITDSSYVALDDTAVGTTGGYIVINGTKFAGNTVIYINGSPVTNTFVNTSTIRATTPSLPAGTANVHACVGSLCALSTLLVSGFPTFTQTTYSSSSLTVSIQLLATGDGTLSYSLYSGSSLPSGLSVSSTGLISGTVSADSTSTFDILLDDSQNQTTQQTITLIISTTDAYWKTTTLQLNGETSDGSGVATRHFYSDASANNYTLALNGDVRPSKLTPFTSSGGTNDGSAAFDGTTDYITATADNYYKLTGDFTIEFWVYAKSLPGTQMGLIAINNAGSNGLSIYVDTTNIISFFVAGNGTVTSTTDTISANVWYHIALVRSSTTNTLYLNGVSKATSSTTPSWPVAAVALSLGRQYGDNTSYCLNGNLSNVRITKQALYTADFTPTTTPLTISSQSATSSNVTLLTVQTNKSPQNNVFIDSSNNDFFLTRNGTLTYSSFTPFTANNWSAYYDGSGDYFQYGTTGGIFDQNVSFTLEMWVYPHAYPGSSDVGLWHPQAASNSNALALKFKTDGTLYIDDQTTGSILTGTTVVARHVWTHIALVRNGSGTNNYKIYINGTAESTTATNTTNKTSILSVYVGLRVDGAVNFNGFISNVRYVKGQALYTANFTPSTVPLTTTSQSANSANVSLLTNNSQRGGAYDGVGNANTTITRSGDIMTAKFGPFPGSTAYNTSLHGGSMYFNGSSDYLSLASQSALALGSGDWTFECWVYHNLSAFSNQQTIYDAENGSATSIISPAIWVDSTNGFVFYVNGGNRINSGTSAVKFRTWQHLSISKVSGTTRMFVDGLQVGPSYTDSNTYIAASLRIGASNIGAAASYWNGWISNLRLIKGTGLYSANNTPSTAPLTAVANTALLLTGINGGVYGTDMESTIYTNNQATQSPAQYKYGIGGLAFDGTADYLNIINHAQQFTFLTFDFTIEGWLYTTTVAAGDRVICSTRTSSSDTTTGRFTLMLSAASLNFYSGSATVLTAGTAVVNTWTHFAVVRGSGSIKLYLNGSQVGATTAFATSMPASLGLTIGDYATTSAGWNGYLDEIRITKGYARYSAASISTPTGAFAGS